MRSYWRAGTALGALAAFGGWAAPDGVRAAEPIKLTVGGYFKQAYMVVTDDDEQGEPGFDRNTDGFFNDAEIHFVGRTTLDNGLEVGARVELEGETESAFDSDLETNGGQIDEAWVWFAGGWGELRFGADDEALANACITPPGGTGNFSAFSPNQWGANANRDAFSGFGSTFSSNTVCTGVDDSGDAQKVVYVSPVFGGFQFTASYTPEGSTESHDDGGGPHLGMPPTDLESSRHNLSAYLTYQYEAEDWGVTAGLGGSWEGRVEDEFFDSSFVDEQDFYQAGVTFSFGRFSIGIAGEYFNDLSTGGNDDEHNATDSWAAGIGAAYEIDAWTFGAQYSHRSINSDFEFNGVDSDHFNIDQDRAVLTAMYKLGPGIIIDGELAYTWLNTEPDEEVFSDGERPDGYDAFEIGIGTQIYF